MTTLVLVFVNSRDSLPMIIKFSNERNDGLIKMIINVETYIADRDNGSCLHSMPQT